jgi:hypothetical protein
MFKTLYLALGALALATPAVAQQSLVSDRPAAKKGDSTTLVCEVSETIGTRLGRRKICLTVQQWNDKHNDHRDFAESIQSGTWGRESAVFFPKDHPLSAHGPQ